MDRLLAMRFPRVVQTLFLTSYAVAQVTVPVNRYDPFSHGANIHEQHLNTGNVNGEQFGKAFSYYVDGAVYAQPLFISNVNAGAKGIHNVLYVATMNDKVYAFDATQPGPPLWMRDFTDEAAGVTPVPITDLTNSNDLNVVGNAGVEGTPVIDLVSQSMFLVARTKEHGRYVQRLHKLDLGSGNDRQVPVIIDARAKGTAQDAVDGFVYFDARAGNQRPALAMSGGNVVIAWASHEDLRPYHGWIMAYDAASLKQTGALCITPDTADGGVWQSGRGPAVDASGALFFEVGNGGWDGKRNIGNSIIKIRVGKSGLEVEDFYTPHDYAQQNERDADLGSTGPMLLPIQHVLLCGNKQGRLLLLNPEKLGGLTPGDTGILQGLELHSGRVMAGPSYWEGPAGPTLYVWNETGVPQAFRFSGSLLNPERVAKGAVSSHGSPGGSLTISADGSRAGTGILWATVGQGRSADHGNAPGVLHAFNAETLEELWSSEANAKRDRLGTLVKFNPPLVAEGRVYVPNYDNAVNVYSSLASKVNGVTNP